MRPLGTSTDGLLGSSAVAVGLDMMVMMMMKFVSEDVQAGYCRSCGIPPTRTWRSRGRGVDDLVGDES